MLLFLRIVVKFVLRSPPVGGYAIAYGRRIRHRIPIKSPTAVCPKSSLVISSND
ncbi:hypothetical protein [Nostoc punctiforme]|uniref:hypothetical protein n=1 Tax=Nostoc punctiforme TaxID=272131 RepID=UPI001427EDB4|nr:hypothetical protein [Nostoc punctiforme]